MDAARIDSELDLVVAGTRVRLSNRPPFKPEQAGGLDAVVVTHEHLDHLDEESLPRLVEASPEVTFVLPEPLVQRLTDLGIPLERVVGAQPDRALELDGLTIHPVPASHGDEPTDAYVPSNANTSSTNTTLRVSSPRGLRR